MYKVKYEKYRYGYGGTQEVKVFSSLEEIADWLFGMVKGKYEGSMFFVNPDDKNDKELHLDSSCISSRDDERYRYWVEQIEKDGLIIYSCGTFTNGVCYWNEEVKQWLMECIQRKKNPQFNFG